MATIAAKSAIYFILAVALLSAVLAGLLTVGTIFLA